MNAGATIHDLLAAARAGLDRVGPEAAHRACQEGAWLVDTRPEHQRRADGEVPGALIVERNHLEWRLDPASDARLPGADDHDRMVIVMCQAGYASSLAAASLQQLGLRRATDLDGGFLAWRAAGLPTCPGGGPPTAVEVIDNDQQAVTLRADGADPTGTGAA